MNRETIENKAKAQAEIYMAESPYQSGPLGSYRKGFIEGANWRINSVWHDVQKELPAPDETVIAEYIIDGEKDYCFTHRSESPRVSVDKHGFCFYIRGAEITRWAYLDDLLPDRKEEAE